MMENNSEELKILIEKAQNGDKQSFRRIFDLLSDRFFSYALSHTSSRDDSMDVVQETFIDLWKSMKKFKYSSDQSFYGFVFKIIKRKLYHYYRKKPKVLSFEQISEKHLVQPAAAQSDSRLSEQIAGLAAKYQDVVRLRYWSQMTFGEIAQALNITESAAKVRHHRALQQLKINLTEDNYA